MALFQRAVLKKYLAQLKDQEIDEAWEKFGTPKKRNTKRDF